MKWWVKVSVGIKTFRYEYIYIYVVDKSRVGQNLKT